MAALWDRHVDVTGPSAAASRARLKQWFWCAALNARYDRAANTQAAKDFAELGRWFAADDGPLPDAVSEFKFDASRLGEYTPRQQAIYKALMALTLRRGVLDFHRAERLTASSIDMRGVDDHHVFPRAYDGVAKQPVELVDSILNRTMIDRTTNIRIGKRAPSDYLAEVRDALAKEGVPTSLDHILEGHGLPSGSDSPLLKDEFLAFIEARRTYLVEQIFAATGQEVGLAGSVVPEDLESVI